MKPVFVETSNVARFHEAIDALDARGAEEACLMVVDGKPGLGKTFALQHWVAQTRSIYLRAAAEWTPMWFTADLLNAMKITPERGFQGRFRQIADELMNRSARAMLDGEPFTVVIDEVDHFIRKPTVMETVRDFSDGTGVPFILVGMGKIRSGLARYGQISSRVGQYVEFEEATLEDVALFVEKKCEVPVADCLVRFLHTASNGYNREIKEGLAAIERYAKRQGGRDFDAQPVSLADLAGKVILNNRADGRAVYVPETVL